MTRIILLDCGPLGGIVHPNSGGTNGLMKAWYNQLVAASVSVRVPEIADYELRRKLIQEDFAPSIALLNQLLRNTGGVIPITSKVMKKAAEYWAHCRKTGIAMCDDKALDGDVILCAQAFVFAGPARTVEIATTNTKHIDRLATAKLWSDIKPS